MHSPISPKRGTAAEFLLNEAGVACLSGTAFGAYGEGYIRFSYANSFENLMEAVKRIESALERRPSFATR